MCTVAVSTSVDNVSDGAGEQTKPVAVRHVSPRRDGSGLYVLTETDRGRVRSHTCRRNTSFSVHEAASHT